MSAIARTVALACLLVGIAAVGAGLAGVPPAPDSKTVVEVRPLGPNETAEGPVEPLADLDRPARDLVRAAIDGDGTATRRAYVPVPAAYVTHDGRTYRVRAIAASGANAARRIHRAMIVGGLIAVVVGLGLLVDSRE
ncbi:MAG: hypothetical protein ABEJ86_03880 [Halococcoides sp.]